MSTKEPEKHSYVAWAKDCPPRLIDPVRGPETAARRFYLDGNWNAERLAEVDTGSGPLRRIFVAKFGDPQTLHVFDVSLELESKFVRKTPS